MNRQQCLRCATKIVLSFSVLFLGSCKDKVSAATINATPNPVPDGEARGSTTIKWDTHHSTDTAQVWVSIDDGAESLFAGGPKGSQQAPWIDKGHRHVFTLYAEEAHSRALVSVDVTRK